MPDSSRDDMGRRLFAVRREKAVEDALEKIRRNVGDSWCHVTPGDCELLKEILGEVWTAIDRRRWESYRFSTLSLEDVIRLLDEGRECHSTRCLTDPMLRSIDRILAHSA